MRKDLFRSAQRASEALCDNLNEQASCIFLTQREIENQSKQLHIHTQKLQKASQQWISLVEAFSAGLKELGDVPTWASRIEEDLDILIDRIDALSANPLH